MSTAKANVGKTVYPVYFDATRSLNKGRRVPLPMCITKPTWKHLVAACKALDLPYDLDKEKAHPKDYFNKGRLRIQVYAELSGPGIERTQVVDRFKNSHEMLYSIGRMLPTIVDKVSMEGDREKGSPIKPSCGPSLASVNEPSGVTLVPRIKKKTKKK